MKQTLPQLLGYKIETKRLILERMTPKSANLLWKLYKEKGSNWYFTYWKALPTRKEIKCDLSYRYSPHFAIIHKKTNKFLGLLTVWEDGYPMRKEYYISYFLHQRYEKNGYMSEAVSAVCCKMKKCHTPYMITLSIDKRNKKSLRVAQKCGFDWGSTFFVNHYSFVPARYEKSFYGKIEKIDWSSLNVA